MNLNGVKLFEEIKQITNLRLLYNSLRDVASYAQLSLYPQNSHNIHVLCIIFASRHLLTWGLWQSSTTSSLLLSPIILRACYFFGLTFNAILCHRPGCIDSYK